jgi:hypothetical protein
MCTTCCRSGIERSCHILPHSLDIFLCDYFMLLWRSNCKDASLNLQMTLMMSYQCHYAILTHIVTALWLISYVGEVCQHLHWTCWVVWRCRNVGIWYLARFEVIMAVTMKITVFWDVTRCSVVDYYHHFRETFYIDLHHWRWRQQVPKQNRTSWMRIHLSCVLLNSIHSGPSH